MSILRLLVRIVVLPVKLAFAFVGLAFRSGLAVGRLPVRAGTALTRTLGWRGVLLLKVGFIVGLLLAPWSGKELRAKIVRLVSGRGSGGTDLTERVTFELAHAPRTWHLPQPSVAVADGTVTLQGAVPHEDGREDLVQTARAIPGVQTVVDELTVEAPAAP